MRQQANRKALERKVEAYIKGHPTLSRYRYGRYDRFLQWAFGNGSVFGFVCFYVLATGLLTYLHIDVSRLGPTWLAEWKPVVNGRPLSELMDAAVSVPITVVSGVLTVVAIAVTILATMISVDGSQVKQQAFFAEANPVGVVRCGLVLLVVLVVNYFWPLHWIVDWMLPGKSMQLFRLIEIVLFFGWTILTIFGALHLLEVTFSFARPVLREETVFRFLVNVVLPRELRRLLRPMEGDVEAWAAANRARVARRAPSPGDPELVESALNRELSTEQVLEDLLANAGRLAASRENEMFQGALALARNVHRFLLLGYTDFQNPDRSPLLRGRTGLGFPVHMNWVRPYAGLFETTVEGLPGSRRMVERCAGTPDSLLGPIGELPVPEPAVTYLLEFHAQQNYAIGRWIEARIAYGGDNGSPIAAGDREALRRIAQSVAADRNSFVEAAKSRFAWSGGAGLDDDRQGEMWEAYCKGWDHLIGELSGLASLVGTAVHFGNRPGAEIYCDLLNRRPARWDHLLGARGQDLRSGVDLLPDQIGRPWSEVSAMIPVVQGYARFNASAVFERLLHATLKDVQIALSAVLLRWAVLDEGRIDICRTFLQALQERTLFDRRYARVYDEMREFNAKDLLFAHLRIRLIEGLHPSRGEHVLNQVAVTDSIRGKSVISLEIFSDDTVREFEALSGELLALLTASYMRSGGRLPDIGKGIRSYTRRSLAQLAMTYQGWTSALSRLRRDVESLEAAMKPDGNQRLRRACEILTGESFPRFEKAVDDLRQDLSEAIACIEDERARFAAQRPLDAALIQEVASWAEDGIREGLLKWASPLEVQEVGMGGGHVANGPLTHPPVTIPFGSFERAAFTTPALITTTSQQSGIGETMKRASAQLFWIRFKELGRQREVFAAPIQSEAAWERFQELVPLAGADPVLLLPDRKVGELLDWVRSLSDDDRMRLRLSFPGGSQPRDTALLADAVPIVRSRISVPILVSRRIAERIDFLAQDAGRAVRAYVEPADADADADDDRRLEIAGSQRLHLRFEMRVSWSGDQPIELHWPEPADDAADSDDDIDLLPKSPENCA